MKSRIETLPAPDGGMPSDQTWRKVVLDREELAVALRANSVNDLLIDLWIEARLDRCPQLLVQRQVKTAVFNRLADLLLDKQMDLAVMFREDGRGELVDEKKPAHWIGENAPLQEKP